MYRYFIHILMYVGGYFCLLIYHITPFDNPTSTGNLGAIGNEEFGVRNVIVWQLKLLFLIAG